MSSDVPPDVPVPDVVGRLAAGEPVRAVWGNEAGGRTYEIGTGRGRRFLKWSPHAAGLDLSAEAARLAWAVPFTPVPRVLDQGATEEASWLLTAGLPGDNAVAARWRADPASAVTAIGEGLRAFHDALPVDECPFRWSIDDRLGYVRRRAAIGALDPSVWHDVHRALGADEAVRIAMDEAPPVEHLVVCHGDTCAPNTLIGDDGRWSGHVDLGAMGVACRWADLSIATWSLEWNYGPGWDRLLLDTYGVDPDPERTRYYRLLWDLGP